MVQLFSNKISVCNTSSFFPRNGVKQGEVLSGYLFSSCYDDLVSDLEDIGTGVLIIHCINNIYKFIFIIIIYADDILLVSTSPHGL